MNPFKSQSHLALWAKLALFAFMALVAGVASIKIGDAGVTEVWAVFVLLFLFALWGMLVRWIKLVAYWDQQKEIQRRFSRYRDPLPGRIVLD